MTQLNLNRLNNPFALFDALFDGANTLDDYGRFSMRSGPQFELKEEDERYLIVGDVPGLTTDDLDVSVENGTLTISGQRNVDAPEGYRAIRTERGTLSFRRSYELGDRIDVTHAEANLVDGVLTLSLPKRPELKPRRIEIQKA